MQLISRPCHFLLIYLTQEKCSYGVITVAKSPQLAILPLREGKTFGQCQKVSKMLKGISKVNLSQTHSHIQS